jgi:hypothetical protein
MRQQREREGRKSWEQRRSARFAVCLRVLPTLAGALTILIWLRWDHNGAVFGR